MQLHETEIKIRENKNGLGHRNKDGRHANILYKLKSDDIGIPISHVHHLHVRFEQTPKFCRKAICEWLSSGIEKLQMSVTKDIGCDFKKDKPDNVKKSVENLEIIQKTINENKTT